LENEKSWNAFVRRPVKKNERRREIRPKKMRRRRRRKNTDIRSRNEHLKLAFSFHFLRSKMNLPI
jgi:hypothetical protein